MPANIGKHAGARLMSVRVARSGTGVEVDVTDDGVGGADPAGGSGLRGLTDRVEALGGTLSIVSGRGQGTRIRAELPCR